MNSRLLAWLHYYVRGAWYWYVLILYLVYQNGTGISMPVFGTSIQSSRTHPGTAVVHAWLQQEATLGVTLL